MPGDVRKLAVVREMRQRNRMFGNSRKHVVVKSQEFFSKNPMFDHITNGLPVQKESSSKNMTTLDKHQLETIPEDRDTTLADLLAAGYEPKESKQESKPSSSEPSNNSNDEGRVDTEEKSGGKRQRDEGGCSDEGGTRGDTEGDSQASKKAKKDEEGEVGRERGPDPEKEASPEPPVCSSEDLP